MITMVASDVTPRFSSLLRNSFLYKVGVEPEETVSIIKRGYLDFRFSQ
jgi:hypothetical protein